MGNTCVRKIQESGTICCLCMKGSGRRKEDNKKCINSKTKLQRIIYDEKSYCSMIDTEEGTTEETTDGCAINKHSLTTEQIKLLEKSWKIMKPSMDEIGKQLFMK